MPRDYQQHRPESTLLYGIVQKHLLDFFERADEQYSRGLPRYVRSGLEGYLRCGIHAHGVARAVCQVCGHELLVAFSCKKRGICPSCNVRRMCAGAAPTSKNVERAWRDVQRNSIEFSRVQQITGTHNPLSFAAYGTSARYLDVPSGMPALLPRTAGTQLVRRPEAADEVARLRRGNELLR